MNNICEKEIYINNIISTFKKEKSLRKTAEIFSLSTTKIRKILITKGEIFTKRSKEINKLIKKGLNNQEIAEKLNISLNTVNSHKPYSRCIYDSNKKIIKKNN